VPGGLSRPPPGDPAGLGAREAVICAASGEPVRGVRRLQGELSCDTWDVIEGVATVDANGDGRANGGNVAMCARCDEVSLDHAMDDPDALEEFESTVADDDMASAW
jgi:hypothetical protein